LARSKRSALRRRSSF